MPASDLAIEARDLGRRFAEHEAVAGVELEVSHGETFGFLGPNGAGKTTCVRMLATLLRPTSGSARVAGFDVSTDAAAVRLRIGVALQATATDPKQTGREYLDLQARLYGLRSAQRHRRIDELAEMVEIGDALDRRIGTYSGGMARRVDLAGALVHQPQVVFLDEPTTGLDPASRIRVWDEITRLNTEQGTTVFLTTQYLEEADALARRIGIIDQGRIVAKGRPVDLKRSLGHDVIVADVDGDCSTAVAALDGTPGVEHVESRGGEVLAHAADGPATIGPVAVRLHEAEVPLRNLSLRTPTLDDVFLELTGNRINPDDETGEQVPVEVGA
ncbi:MAG: ATP-binding cassette domain-containing protein [Actinomycetia bacterium]|nr:ATP-binding cassette domain-containing protein [Actinomycetes bacterium]